MAARVTKTTTKATKAAPKKRTARANAQPPRSTAEHNFVIRASNKPDSSSRYGYPTQLIEEPPHRQLVWHLRGKIFDLPLPWTYYVVSDTPTYCSIAQLYFAPERVEKVGDLLAYAFLPNMSGVYAPCYHRPKTPGKTLRERFAITYNWWWDSTCHYDLGDGQWRTNRAFAEALGMTSGSTMATALANWERLDIEGSLKLPYVKASHAWGNFNKLIDEPLV